MATVRTWCGVVREGLNAVALHKRGIKIIVEGKVINEG